MFKAPFQLLVVSFLLGSVSQAAYGASARVEGRVKCDSRTCGLGPGGLEITGELDASTVVKVKRLLDETHERADREKKKASLWDVSIDSPGGSVSAAMAIGRMLRKERLRVTVPYSGVCYSACVLIYAGAVGRGSLGKIGIHRPYFEVLQQKLTPEKIKELYLQMLQDIRAYFREMNVSEQLADAMLHIDPEKLRLLDDDALNSYGLTPEDPIEQEAHDLDDARDLGINRQEYMRRKTLKDVCNPLAVNHNSLIFKCWEMVMKTGKVPFRAPPQDEAAYDREICVTAGNQGPNIEQCVRASALRRESMQPRTIEPIEDFSQYGVPLGGIPAAK
jgi:hypothetical protein